MIATSIIRVWVGDKKLKLQWNGSVYKVVQEVSIKELPKQPFNAKKYTVEEVTAAIQKGMGSEYSGPVTPTWNRENRFCYGYPKEYSSDSMNAFARIWNVKSWILEGECSGSHIVGMFDCDDNSLRKLAVALYVHPGTALFEYFGAAKSGTVPHAYNGTVDDRGELYLIDPSFGLFKSVTQYGMAGYTPFRNPRF